LPIWFPIANNHHLHNQINDQAADNIPATINPHTVSGKSGPYTKLSVGFAVADDHQFNKSITDTTPNDVQPTINPRETSSTNRQTSIRPDYRSPFNSQAKANLVDE
jgi:hypothetical protein